MFHKILSIRPLDDLKLEVRFVAGEIKLYDVSQLFKRLDAFQDLENIVGLFETVQVDTGGYGVSWNDDLDLSCDEIWLNGTLIENPFEGMMSLKVATDLWGLNESTLRKAISYEKLEEGWDVQKFGKQWIVTKEAMLREYGEPKKSAS